MKTVSASQYNAIVAGAEVIEPGEGEGPYVLRTADDRIVKQFRRSRGWVGDRLWPYASRFASNARRLARRGVRSAAVEGVFHCPGVGTDFVVYPMLPGTALRAMPPGSAQLDEALRALPAYMAGLHERGIHFRGIHLGNVLYHPGDGFALIDVGYMRFFPWPLDVRSRVSNFSNILRYDQDRLMLTTHGLEVFLRDYLEASGLPTARRRTFCERLAARSRDAGVRAVLSRLDPDTR